MTGSFSKRQNAERTERLMKSLDKKYQEWFRDPVWAAKFRKNIQQYAEQKEWQERIHGRKVA